MRHYFSSFVSQVIGSLMPHHHHHPHPSTPGLRSGLIALAAIAVTTAAAPGQANAQTAQAIVDQMLSRDAFGWDEAESTVQMVLVDKKNKTKVREMETLRRRKDGRLQSVVRFRSPQEVAGTAFLMRERSNGDSEQYIYLPRLRRTRKVVGREREGSFMGSDFSYADFERRDTRESTHRKLPNEKYGKYDVFVIESTPRAGVKSPYSRIQTWVRKDNYLPLKIEFFDQKNRLLKTFKTKRIKKMNGRPVIMEARMENHQTRHSTKLELKNLQPRPGLPDTEFTPTALEHG